MTIYRVYVGRNEYRIDVSEKRLLVNGEPIQANLIALNEVGAYLLRLGDRKREIQVSAEGKSVYSMTSRGRRVIARVEKGIGRLTNMARAVNENTIIAPMPGLVIDVLVHEGDRVQNGQALVIMKSMKMQMEMRAPAAGTVEKIFVAPQSQVEKSAALVKMKEE